MKDKFHVELQENQIVSQVNWNKPTLALVRGGYTNGGKVRLVSLTRGGAKGNAKPHHLVVLTNAQAISLAHVMIEEMRQTIERWNIKHEDIDLNEYQRNYIPRNIEVHEHKIRNIEVLIDVLRQGGDGKSITFRKV